MADYKINRTGAALDVTLNKVDEIEARAEVNPTDAETKTAYENNSDTNAFTDTDKADVDALGTLSTFDEWTGTQVEYDALGSYDSNTYYFVNDL